MLVEPGRSGKRCPAGRAKARSVRCRHCADDAVTAREALRQAVEKEKRKAEARLRAERERGREKLRAERRRTRQRLLAERKRAKEKLLAARERKEKPADPPARAEPVRPKRSADTEISPRLKRRVEALRASGGCTEAPGPSPGTASGAKVVAPGILRQAAAIVAKQFDLALADLNSRPAWGLVRPGAEVSFARQVLRYLLTVELDLPMAVVAKSLGCDRTTVRHGNRRIEDRRDDAAFDALMNDLGAMVRACNAGR